MNPNLEGIGSVRSINYRDGKLWITIILEGLEDHPLEIEAENIKISADGSAVEIGRYAANIAFAQNALNQFGKKFSIPEGKSRTGLLMAKKILGL